MSVPVTPFPTTRWSLLSAATVDDAEQRRKAIEELTRLYLAPIRAYVASIRMLPASDVDDVVQGFIQSKWLEQNLPGRAQEGKGRFRNYLLRSIKHYVCDRLAQLKTERGRAGGSIEETAEANSAEHPSDTPEEAFERAWAEQVLSHASERMRKQCESEGRLEIWGVFEERLLRPALFGADPAGYTDLVQRFRFESPGQASNILMTAKRMFGRTLRGVVADFEGNEMTIEETVGELYSVLTRHH